MPLFRRRGFSHIPYEFKVGQLLAKAEQHVDVTPPTLPPILQGARKRGKGAILRRRAEARTLEEADRTHDTIASCLVSSVGRMTKRHTMRLTNRMRSYDCAVIVRDLTSKFALPLLPQSAPLQSSQPPHSVYPTQHHVFNCRHGLSPGLCPPGCFPRSPAPPLQLQDGGIKPRQGSQA